MTSTSRLLRCLAVAVVIVLSGCGGCQEQQISPPKPVVGKLPPVPGRKLQTPLPAKPACAVFAFSEPAEGPAPLKVQFRAEGDCSEGQANYLWSFGDGTPPAPGEILVHTYEKPGTYKAVVEVSSSTNPSLRDKDDIEVQVTPARGTPGG